MKSLPLYHKPRKKHVGPEAQLQIAVCQYLKLAGVPGLLYFSVANEQKCSVQRGAMLKKMGKLAGVSDLVIVIPSRFRDSPSEGPTILFLELKAKGNKPDVNQLAFHDAAYAAGACWEWADNIDDAISILTEFGAIKPVSRRSSPLKRAA
jgi:hypothetical protein